MERDLQTISINQNGRCRGRYHGQDYVKSPFGPFLQTLATDASCIINPNVMKHEKDGDLAQAWLAQNMDGAALQNDRVEPGERST